MKIVEAGGSGSSTDETTGYRKFLDGRCAYFPAGTWDIGAFQAIKIIYGVFQRWIIESVMFSSVKE